MSIKDIIAGIFSFFFGNKEVTPITGTDKPEIEAPKVEEPVITPEPEVTPEIKPEPEPEVETPKEEVETPKEEPKPIEKPKTVAYLALIIGHTKADKGALAVAPLKMQEYTYNTEVANITKEAGPDYGIEVEIFTRDAAGVKGAYSSATKWLDSKKSKGAIMELHFNAANGVATGTETLYADVKDEKGVNEKAFAQAIQDAICDVFKRTGKQNRGLKRETGAKGERGYSNLSQTVKYPSTINEPFFGDVPSDAKLALELQKEYAICLLVAYKNFLK